MNTTILLYGELGNRFGKEHSFSIETPAEALRALAANFPDFIPYLNQTNDKFMFFIGDEPVGREEELFMTFGEPVLKIVPAVEGEGGIFKIIIGAALMYFSGGTLAKFGLSLILSGVSEMLFSPPEAPSPREQGSRAENIPNYSFAGPVNTVAQGNCVPVGYGQLEIGSQVISAGLTV